MAVLITTNGINMAAMEMMIRRMMIVIIMLIMMMMVTNILVIWETQGGHHTI